MGLHDYMDWLVKIGCGWLGWSIDQLNATHLQYVELAYNGKIEMLKACFGSSDKQERKQLKKAQDFTAQDFDNMFGARKA